MGLVLEDFSQAPALSRIAPITPASTPAATVDTPTPEAIGKSDADKFHQNLADLAFTYHEARVAILKEMDGLITALGDAILPMIGEDGFGAMLAVHLRAAIENAADAPVIVSVSQQRAGELRALMPDDPILNVEIQVDTSLPPDEALIRIGTSERAVEMAPLIEHAQSAVAAYRDAIASEGAASSTSAPHMEAAHA